MNTRKFDGKWITDDAFADLHPRNVFHRQKEKFELSSDPNTNSHVLFRKRFNVSEKFSSAIIYITADDYYKLYINGEFAAQGPAPSYHFNYNYNAVDITKYLHEGKNVIAVHTYYQGLINRVWQSGDFRHGLLLDLVIDGKTVVKSDESFLTHRHTGYTAMGTFGYQTQFAEGYDSRARERDFYLADFDDGYWNFAKKRNFIDYGLKAQKTSLLDTETIIPVSAVKRGGEITIDFGRCYVGYLSLKARGKNGDKIIIYSGQELTEDGVVRQEMRCYCNYREDWILSGNDDVLMQFDYKSFRYVRLEFGFGTEIYDIQLIARHYPFELKANLNPVFKTDPDGERIWNLCVNSQKYGVQETIQDCMDREKGFYLGDGCYSALANFVLTGDDTMARKLIDDAFSSSFITEGLVTCMDCSFMQEIAEFPLILVSFILWHYRLSGDKEYLKENYFKAVRTVESYRTDYEKNGLICDLDKWCVVEWPENYRDGYAVGIVEGKVCKEAHVAINAYYLNAVNVLNKIAYIVGEKEYRNTAPLKERFIKTFYDSEKHLFCDGAVHRHVSLVGNVFPYAFSLMPDEEFENAFLRLLDEKGYAATSLFTSFPLLSGFAVRGETERMLKYIFDDGTWKRMLKEGATTTFEAWGKDCKWNTSLFHLTLSHVAVFMSDIDLKKLFFV